MWLTNRDMLLISLREAKGFTRAYHTAPHPNMLTIHPISTPKWKKYILLWTPESGDDIDWSNYWFYIHGKDTHFHYKQGQWIRQWFPPNSSTTDTICAEFGKYHHQTHSYEIIPESCLFYCFFHSFCQLNYNQHIPITLAGKEQSDITTHIPRDNTGILLKCVIETRAVSLCILVR